MEFSKVFFGEDNFIWDMVEHTLFNWDSNRGLVITTFWRITSFAGTNFR